MISFSHPVVIRGLARINTILKGRVDTEFFGDKAAPLSEITVWFAGIPQKWFRPHSRTHYEGMTDKKVHFKENGTAVVPANSLGLTALSGFTLKAGGWTATLSEIPVSHRSEPSIAHVCNISNENETLTGATAQDFLNDNLFPFLNFTFGRNTRPCKVMGYDGSETLWARVFPQYETPHNSEQGNWFLRSGPSPIDLSALFRHFCNLSSNTKRHWRKVIGQYSIGEEIMGALRESPLAASISFAALEGLTRSIISTYPCKDEWLETDLRLKRGKHIKDAIEMVAGQELGPHSKTFREASEQIAKVRNATLHTALMSDEDPINAFHRWNASQALVEILLLCKMGLEKIPNRTAPGEFRVMGKDMYEDLRKESLVFGPRDDNSDHEE